MKKCAKFGGSSLANASQIKKVSNIILSDLSIRAVVVSSPGKRYDEDIKVIYLLIELYQKFMNKDDKYKIFLEKILKRYEDIVVNLNLDKDILKDFEAIINNFLENNDDLFYLENAIKSCGEDFNAWLISQYIKSQGIDCEYLSPKKAGILV